MLLHSQVTLKIVIMLIKRHADWHYVHVVAMTESADFLTMSELKLIATEHLLKLQRI